MALKKLAEKAIKKTAKKVEKLLDEENFDDTKPQIKREETSPPPRIQTAQNIAQTSMLMANILPVALMLGGAVAVYFVGKKILGGISDGVSGTVDFLTKQEQNIDDAVIEKEILKASISKTEARRMAQGLYDSMAGWGTDEERIAGILSKIQNKADYLMIHKEFGLRPYGDYGADTWLEKKISADRHLAYWLKSELDEGDAGYDLAKKWVTLAGFGF